MIAVSRLAGPLLVVAVVAVPATASGEFATVYVESKPVEILVAIPSAGYSARLKKKKRLKFSKVPPGSHEAVFKVGDLVLPLKFKARAGDVLRLQFDYYKKTAFIEVHEMTRVPTVPLAPPEGAAAALSTPGGAFPHRILEKPPKMGARYRMHMGLERGLQWLAAHQATSGAWEAAGFPYWCDGKVVQDSKLWPDGIGMATYDLGVTGLALCAFLGAGYAPDGEHAYSKAVSRGLRYVRAAQNEQGCFGHLATQQAIYNHATCTLAMVEAYGMTGSRKYWQSAQRALNFIWLARNPWFVWRYGVKPGDNDTSVTGWMMQPIRSAEIINAHAREHGASPPFELDPTVWRGIGAWIEKIHDLRYGRGGYVMKGTGPSRPADLKAAFPQDESYSCTAVVALARLYIGKDQIRRTKPFALAAGLCEYHPPRWSPEDGTIDMAYWYYGTMALFQWGKTHWDKWRRPLLRAVLNNQRKDGDPCRYKGSWDPIGPWGRHGGRVYSTAMMVMCLSAYRRYAREEDIPRR